MKFKGLFGAGKEHVVEAEAEIKAEPVVEAKA